MVISDLFGGSGGSEKSRLLMREECSGSLSSLATDTTGQLDVLGHDGHSLGVDGAQVGVLKQTNQVSFAGFLQGHDSRALETQVGLEVLGDFTYQTLEGQLPDQQLSALLVTTDLTEGDCSRPVTMGFLDSSSSWGTLASCLGGQLLSGGLASSGLSCSLLGTSHLFLTAIACQTEYMPVANNSLYTSRSSGPGSGRLKGWQLVKRKASAWSG